MADPAPGSASADPYAPPAAQLDEAPVEELGWASFSASRRIGIAGCAAGMLGCAGGLAYALQQVQDLGLDASAVPRIVAISAALAAIHAASLAALWPARRLRWLRVLAALSQVPVAGLAGMFAFETAMTLSSRPAYLGDSFWYEGAVLSSALVVPALAFWMACGASGHAWWQARRAPARG